MAARRAATTTIVLDERDSSELLRILANANGKKNAPQYVLVCLCGATADIRKDEHAWDGWQVAPGSRCPECIEAGTPAQDPGEPSRARVIFEVKLRMVKQ